MIGYPTNRLLLVLDDPAAAPAALRDLAEIGVRPEDVSVLVGKQGVEQLHRLGGSRGLLGRLVRMFQFMSMDQMPDFVMYEAALEDGRAVVAARPRNRAQMLAIRDVLARHGGHFANWFGRFSTEELSRWRGPEPDIPGYLRR
jgi:hypothetical protein